MQFFSRSLYLIVLCSSLHINSFAQFDSIKQALSSWQTDYPQEKVFVQTDKTWYLAGENIWMKAWCVTNEGPTFLSRILYVDLVDVNGTVVQKKMYQLDSLGSTAADFNLPVQLKSGNYSINAYTLWMLNFPNLVFSRNIFIYGPDYKTTYARPAVKRSELKLHFFPEGGTFISGVENRVAFKAMDEEGFPLSCKGFISDETGKRIVDINTEHNGHGAISFLVEPGRQYTASIPTGSTGSLDFKLPTAKQEGIAVQVNNSNPNRLFIVLNRAEVNKSRYNIIKVVAQLNYQVVYTALLNLDEGQTAASINKKNLPPGLMQITIFDPNDLPLAERIAFIENYQFLEPDIETEVLNPGKKGYNRVSFKFDNDAPTALSCLVTAYNPLDSNTNDENIAASLLFGTELKGHIFTPGYYVKDKKPETLRHLDLLLMTQGWRRFEWKKLLAKELPIIKYPIESAITFRGTMFKSDRKEIIKDGKVSFIIKGADSTSILAEATVTDKGEFFLPNIHFIKEATVAYMGTNNKQEKFIVDVKLFPNYIDSLKRSFHRPTINLDTADIFERNKLLSLYLQKGFGEIDSINKFKELSNVTIRSRKISKVDSLNNEYATGIFAMGSAVDPANFPHYPTVWQMLQASVPGLTVEGNPFDPVVNFNRFGGMAVATDQTDGSGSTGNDLSLPPMMESNGITYFLNEINVSKDVINSLSPGDVALIKVLKNEAAALGASQGAIAFYTKTGAGYTSRIYDKSYTQLKQEGYGIVKEFYSPDYTIAENKNLSDTRFTLFWSGGLQPAKDGKYRFQFYNNDLSTKFRIIVQGMDRDGQFILKEKIF